MKPSQYAQAGFEHGPEEPAPLLEARFQGLEYFGGAAQVAKSEVVAREREERCEHVIAAYVRPAQLQAPFKVGRDRVPGRPLRGGDQEAPYEAHRHFVPIAARTRPLLVHLSEGPCQVTT